MTQQTDFTKNDVHINWWMIQRSLKYNSFLRLCANKIAFYFIHGELSLLFDWQVLEVNIVYEISDGLDSPEFEFPVVPPPKQSFSSLSHQSGTGSAPGSFVGTTSNGRVRNKRWQRKKSNVRQISI